MLTEKEQEKTELACKPSFKHKGSPERGSRWKVKRDSEFLVFKRLGFQIVEFRSCL
jgi:hypothetical protein